MHTKQQEISSKRSTVCEVLKSWGTLYKGGQGVERVRASDHRMVIGGYVGS